jgi:putative MFS transporter
MINTRGRKQTLAFMLGTFATFSALLLVPGPNGLLTFFACVSRGAMLGAYATIYVYTPEVYPTDLRTTALGACSAFSRIGGALAPFVARVGLQAIPPNLTFPILFFAIICGVGSVLSMLLPVETRGRDLDRSGDDPSKLLAGGAQSDE